MFLSQEKYNNILHFILFSITSLKIVIVIIFVRIIQVFVDILPGNYSKFTVINRAFMRLKVT